MNVPTYHRKPCGCEGPGWDPPRSQYLCEQHRLTPEERAVIETTERWIDAHRPSDAGLNCYPANCVVIAVKALRKSREPRPRYYVAFYEFQFRVIDDGNRDHGKKDICICGNEDDADHIAAVLNAAEDKK